MVVFDDTIYVERDEGYTKAELHKAENGVYYLVTTADKIRKLGPEYEVLTWPELLARYSHLATPATPSRRVARTPSKED